MKLFNLMLISLMILSTGIADEEKKSITTVRTETPPVIDGVIDEAVWDLVTPATGFFKFQPESGGPAPVKTEIKFLFDDVALYVSAIMYEPDPSQILTQLGSRDDDDVVADWLGIWISPFNDGTNDLNFLVTAAGVQVDRKFSPTNIDGSWNPVWSSDVSIHELGWSLEMAIPLSQIRFPAQDVQLWGINVARYRASEREVYTWAYLDKAIDNFTQQAGLLYGIKNIETPLRLSFTPYASVNLESFPAADSGETAYSTGYRGGMDLKYGINESFTLDMTLIPDFGQVQSDNEVLNLSPFEIRYDEHRPFFTEGTQLLHKANLFYSRRVGSRPARYWQVEDNLENGEEIISNPDVTQLINATKVTGQTVNGIGIGFFNAITAPMYATIEDSAGSQRDYLTNPLSNYNLIVIGKNLNNGSDFSIANSNVQRFSSDDDTDDFRDANVIGFETRLVTKDSKWVLESSGAYNSLFYTDSISTGYRFQIDIAEELGSLQYGFGQGVESEHFNPNDMGFLRQSNEIDQFAWVSLRTLNPVWKVNDANINIEAVYSSLFTPRVYTGVHLNSNYNVTFKNYYSFGGGFSWSPKEGHDYYEPRVDDRDQYFTTPKSSDFHVWVASNYNKPFSMSGWVGTSAITRRGAYWRGSGLNPKWRINNRWQIRYELDLNYVMSGHGFADYDAHDNPIFGRRDQVTITNSLNSQYIFSRNLESDIRVRYYRSSLDYLEFFDLGLDGELYPNSYNADLDEVFGVFTLDAVLNWRFSPGSELNLTWKNVIYSSGDDPSISYMEDLKNLPDLDQSNSLSFKLLYYVDAWDLKHRL